MSEATIVASQLAHDYRGTQALAGVSLRVQPGRLAGVIGADGVGKSTLLALIAGTRRLQRGRLEVLGCDLGRRRERRRASAQLAYLPQGLGASLHMDLTAMENIAFSARLFRVPSERAEREATRLLAATGLSSATDRRAGDLSGGMKQKLGLCCALIHAPKLLVLDEPTTGVDPLSRRGFWQLIDQLRTERPELAVLVATSYMDEAEPFDDLTLLSGGRVLARGSCGELCEATGAERLEQAYAHLIAERGDLVEHRPTRRNVEASPASRSAGAGGTVIDARGLTRRFGSVLAVDSVSFQVSRGEIFGFVGPNGSGKTTTLKMLTGILPPSGGEAYLLGEPVTGRSLRQRAHTGYMSQSFSLRQDLTGRENLRLYGHLLDVPRSELSGRIDELAERYGFRDSLDQRASAVPLGVRQRLALAAALLHTPPILVLDEPTSGADPLAREAFWESIEILARDDGVTALVSTHYLSEASRCDRVALMNAGRVLGCDSPGSLVQSVGARNLEEAFATWIREDERQQQHVRTEVLA